MAFPRPAALTVAALLAASGSALAQDLYDPTVLRTIQINFYNTNWLQLLRNNYASQTNILADVIIDGVVHPNAGVRIRGNTSYTALPAGSEKFSLNIDLDFVHLQQNFQGYQGLNLNNGWRDPTFCREALYNNFVAQFIPNMRANHVVVLLNGQNWGVYVNVQQFDQKLLGTAFADTTGLRIKCANNPNGPGLRYNGSLPSGYTGYEIKDPGGLANPWQPLIDTCWSVTNEPLTSWQNIDTRFAIDPSIWSVVLENMLTDDDSYVNKGADFMTYRDPIDLRMFLLQTDANETFTQTTWTITRNFTQTTKPVLNRVLAVPELRQRYMAHYRTARTDLNWAYFGPKAQAMRELIDSAVQQDPKKLYSYTLFQNNFTSTVTMPYTGLAGGTIIGLQQFVDQRAAYLNGQAELVAPAPQINSVEPSDPTPDPAAAVTITANVTAVGSPVAKVELFYRPTPASVFQRVLMNNLGGGVYSAQLPVTGTPGQRVKYYVAATAANTYASVSFFPKRTEWAPLQVEYTFGATGGVRITEWMYNGVGGEFFELTNRSGAPIDMTGWSFDDNHATPGTFSLGAFGTVMPGESVIVCEASAESFRGAWGLSPGVKIIGDLGLFGGNNLSRNDEINIYDSAGVLIDRLAYGDQVFPGTVQANNVSAQTCSERIGQNEIGSWVLSSVGDQFGSITSFSGSVGRPGAYNAPSCNGCYANCDGSTVAPILNVADFSCFLQKFGMGDAYANCDGSTVTPVLNVADFSCFLQKFAAGCP